ncbi:MAG: hypothetical protein CL853_08445 [Crocinitomicaceae bacterium]|nr:hypothetical protein [Crocinitomicaceae bacterium]
MSMKKYSEMTLYKYSTVLIALLLSSVLFAQITVTSNTMTVEQYVQNVLVGAGVTISNVQYNGGSANVTVSQVGAFSATNSTIGINNGLVMATGDAQLVVGPNNSGSTTLGGGNMGQNDVDLDVIVNPNGTNDACVIEFDFIPIGDSVKFNYVFGSEEYLEWVNSSFNDVFGFFLSGPGITGSYSNNAVNIATIPGTNTAVSINNVNNVSNSSYYIDNGDGFSAPQNTDPTVTQLDGITVVLEAAYAVQCNQTYHIKLAIADAGDTSFDSGVFLEGGSFSSAGVSVEAGIANGDTLLYEGCNSAYFAFAISDTTQDFTVQFDVVGSATNGVDYNQIPDSLTIPAGVSSDTIFVNPTLDTLNDPNEDVTIYIYYETCSGWDTLIASLTITDYVPLYLTLPDSVNICPELDGPFLLEGDWGGGLQPYSFSWSDGSSTSNSTSVAPFATQDYYLSITDGCGDPISDTTTVWVQCPLEEINIFTPNGDGNNDYFIPVNLDDYPNPTIVVFNRWGKIVYEMENYQYDWDGTNYKTGNELNDGVYFYVVTPNSVKYEYNKHKKEEVRRTISGYVHLIR